MENYSLIIFDTLGSLNKIIKSDIVNYFFDFYTKEENKIIFFKSDLIYEQSIIDFLNKELPDEYIYINFNNYKGNCYWFNNVFINEKPLNEVINDINKYLK